MALVSSLDPELVVTQSAEKGFSLYFFDFLDLGVIIRRGGCRAGVDLLVVFEQPGNLPERQTEASLITLTLLLPTYFTRM